MATLLTVAEPTINIPTMKRVVSEIVIKRRKVVMFRGPAGVGKTFGIRDAADENNAFLVETRLGQFDSVDIRGMPDIDKLTSTTCWYAPGNMPFVGSPGFPTDRTILWFLDEITSASPPVFAIAYQLLQDFAVGEHKVMPNVVICAAGNNDSDRGVVNRMPAPLNNRMMHFQIGVDVPAWCMWALNHGVPPQFIAYHRWKKNNLLMWDPDVAEPPPTIPTPRSWQAAAEVYRDFNDVDPDFCAMNMAACVGEGETVSFLAFDKIFSKVLTTEQIVKNPKGVPLPDEESLTYATAVSVSSAMTLANVKPLHQFLVRLNPEYVVMAWQLALARKDAKGNPVGESLYQADEFLDIGDRYKAIFDPISRKAA